MKSTTKQLNWAILGVGEIANQMAEELAAAGRRIYSVGNRRKERAVAFAEKYGVGKVYDCLEELFVDPEVDAVYIATPHNSHYEYIMKALENGKHVLAEKAITLNSGELAEVAALAKEKELVLAEAMTLWHMPLYRRLSQELSEGRFGKVQVITANFGSVKDYDMTNRFFNMDLAGGALLDLGVYSLSAIRSFMKISPECTWGQVKLAPSGADEQSVILLTNEEGQMATVALSLHAKQPKRIMISCEKAYIEIMEYPRADKAVIVDAITGERREIEEGSQKCALLYEIEDMETAVAEKKPEIMKLESSCDVMAVMTKLRKGWGVKYPGEIW